MENLLGKTLPDLQAITANAGWPRFVARQIADWLYGKRVSDIDHMTNLSLKARAYLSQHYTVGRHAPVHEVVSNDGTRKYLFQIENQKSKIENLKSLNYVESVYIPEEDRATLCVSTQIGCKMGCKFCMTGTLGFHGQLSATEILNQIFAIDQLQIANNRLPISNVVLMGEGEPMDNIDQVLRALEIMTASYGPAWSPKRITVSSVGVIPGLKRFLDESDCHLAISLHNPFPEERREIMPAEKAWSIEKVVELLRQYDFTGQRRVSFEYICWAGVNDTPRHAEALVSLLRGLECRINLIRFHEGEENHKSETLNLKSSDEKRMIAFRDYLTTHGLTTTIRRSRGEDILAACGMLIAKRQEENR